MSLCVLRPCAALAVALGGRLGLSSVALYRGGLALYTEDRPSYHVWLVAHLLLHGNATACLPMRRSITVDCCEFIFGRRRDLPLHAVLAAVEALAGVSHRKKKSAGRRRAITLHTLFFLSTWPGQDRSVLCTLVPTDDGNTTTLILTTYRGLSGGVRIAVTDRSVDITVVHRVGMGRELGLVSLDRIAMLYECPGCGSTGTILVLETTTCTRCTTPGFLMLPWTTTDECPVAVRIRLRGHAVNP